MKKIILRLYKDKKKIRQYASDKITNKIWNIISLKPFTKAYVKVTYGKKEDIHGRMANFYNDGWYSDKKELIEVIRTFWNET